MKLDQNLILILVGSIILVFFGGRILGNIFQLIWNSLFKKNHTKDHNLDELIKKQEQFLRKGFVKKENFDSRSKNKSSANKISRTEARYLSEGSKSKIQGFKKILTLLDNLKWGEGEIYNDLRKQLKLKLNQEIDLIEFSQIIVKAFKEDYFLKLKDERLPNYDELEKAIISKIFLKLIFSEAEKEDGSFISKLSKANKTQEIAAIQSIQFYFQKKMGRKEEELYFEIVNSKSNPLSKISEIEIDHLIDKIVISPDHSSFVSTDIISRDLKKLTETFSNLESIPPLKSKKDTLGAYKILKVKEGCTMKELKKSYKNLVKSKHPDKFSGKNLPKSAEKIIHENFANIQSAYDLLKKNLKD